MGRLFKHERLRIGIEDLSKQLEAMEQRYEAVLANGTKNNTKSNRRSKNMLSEHIEGKKNEIKRMKEELKNLTCRVYE